MTKHPLPRDIDVAIIGSGVNGLSAAALLATRGRRVAVFEANAHPGGAVATAEVTLPGFAHDLFAMNLGLFAGGPVMAQLGEQLGARGLDLVGSAAPFCSVFDDGSMIGVEADPAATERNVAAIAPGDLPAWRRLRVRLDRWLPHIGGLLGTDLLSPAAAKTVWKAQRSLGFDEVLEIARLGLSSTRAFTEEHFDDPRTRALLAAWGMHLDFAPDVSGGALFSFLETFGGEKFGMVIGKGGAVALVDALVGVIEAHGGSVHCNAPVTAVDVVDGAATGLVLGDGTRIRAGQVVANVNPRLLPDLLPPGTLTSSQDEVRTFRPGLATMMIHCALSDLPAWRAADAQRFNYVHVGGTIDDMALAYTQAAAGRLPDRPVLVVGQPTVSDPSRAPEGQHVLWVQVRVLPSVLASGQAWSEVAEAYADQVMAILEEHAPGLSEQVLARHVMSPADLESANRNLVGGDSLGGSHHPAQYFFLRPRPGFNRHRAPVRNLYLCGAGTWPGAGVGGVSGALVADLIQPPAPVTTWGHVATTATGLSKQVVRRVGKRLGRPAGPR